MPEQGDMAPDFTLEGVDSEGAAVTVSLAALRGRTVVLYFYPKDDTPGCTAQACDIRDRWSEFGDAGAVVLGVSPDDVESHRRFAARYALPFTLLADPDHEVAEAYGVWRKKLMFGKKYFGVERSTFVIDADGRIAAAMRRVKPAAHAGQVLEAVGGI